MDSILPTYIHIINPKLKYIYLSFDANGELIVKSPKVSQMEIERVLIKRSAWIERSRAKVINKKGKSIHHNSGDKLYYLGREYAISYKKRDRKRVSLLFDEDVGFTLLYDKFDPKLFDRHILEFYKDRAKDIIPDMTHRYSLLMDLYPSKIAFRKAKRQWGSCSDKNAISFNYLMMKLPLNVIQYIVVHELAHIRYKNHQKEFWRLVEKYMPNYREMQSELKNYI